MKNVLTGYNYYTLIAGTRRVLRFPLNIFANSCSHLQGSQVLAFRVSHEELDFSPLWALNSLHLAAVGVTFWFQVD